MINSNFGLVHPQLNVGLVRSQLNVCRRLVYFKARFRQASPERMLLGKK